VSAYLMDVSRTMAVWSLFLSPNNQAEQSMRKKKDKILSKRSQKAEDC
jgi:hypothetical protein